MPPLPPVGASAELPLRVQLITLNVEWSLYMPPPYRPDAEPFVIISPEIPTLAPPLTRGRRGWRGWHRHRSLAGHRHHRHLLAGNHARGGDRGIDPSRNFEILHPSISGR